MKRTTDFSPVGSPTTHDSAAVVLIHLFASAVGLITCSTASSALLRRIHWLRPREPRPAPSRQ